MARRIRLEVVIIAVVLSQIGLVRDVPYTGSRQVDVVGAILSVVGSAASCSSVLVWQEAGEFVGLLMVVGACAGGAARWLIRRKRGREVTQLVPDLFRHDVTAGSTASLQQVTLAATIALPLFFQMTLEYDALESVPDR